MGETIVTCTATDISGKTASCDFKVVVRAIIAKSDPGGMILSRGIPGAILQEATSVSGPWSDVSGATSPLVVPPVGPGKFYRIIIPE